MILDWLSRDGAALLSWWLLTTLAGVAVFPLVFRLARGLPGRGYALARTAGIILVAYLYWILNILGLLHNDAGNAALVAILLFVIGIASYLTWREREPLIPWLRAHLGLIVATELIFAAAFLGWAFVRALNPDMSSTEKPMEMAFMAATRRSISFPPNDPWMSGYAISYYHFGYIMMATLGTMSGVTNSVMFSLSAALMFALTCTGAFGLGYELVAARQAERVEAAGKLSNPNPLPHPNLPQNMGKGSNSGNNAAIVSSPEVPLSEREGFRVRASPFAVGILAAVLLAIMGNLGTAAVEVPFQYKMLPDSYFQFMDIKGRDTVNNECAQTNALPPTCYLWWWPWSRVIRDRQLNGTPIEIIDEFPMFSFILSDVHPHVLALPFVLLALGLMLNLVLRKRGLHPWEFLFYAICIGGLLFLNSWDALFIAVLIGAEALRRLIRNGRGAFTREDIGGLAGFAGLILLATGLLYLPFLISFRSQVGGILPDVIWPTRFQQFFIMFGTFLVILAAFVGAEVWRAGASFNRRLAARVIGYTIGLLGVIVVASILLAVINPSIRQTVLQNVDESGGVLAAIPTVLLRRLEGLPTEGFLLLIIFGVIGRLFAREVPITPGAAKMPSEPGIARRILTYSPSTGFVLLLIGAGAVLTLTPDFIYLQDGFGTRINMIFKLYYQTWAVWSIASAYAVWSLLGDVSAFRLPTRARVAFGVAATVFIAAGLIYAPLAIDSHNIIDGGHQGDPSRALTLDGGLSLVAKDADDYAVINCLSNLSHGDSAVVAEGMVEPTSYSPQYGRVSVLSGIPTLMGWSNHESQWRGPTYYAIKGTRVADEAMLYNTLDWKVAQRIIDQYHITYVYVGPTERSLYQANGGLAKFATLTPICKSGDVAAYATDTMSANLAASAAGS